MRRHSHGPRDKPRRWWVAKPEIYDEVQTALAAQPFLRLQERGDHLFAKGRFVVRDKGVDLDSSPCGFTFRQTIHPVFPSWC